MLNLEGKFSRFSYMLLLGLGHAMMQEEFKLENLPEDIKLEILLHMPVKSLKCMKLVSKSWHSRILSNPNFPKLHAQRQSGQHPNRILLTTCPQLRSIDINASLHDDSDTKNLDFQPQTDDVCLVGSCRGIVLLLLKEEHLCILNPVTGSYKPISLPPHYKSVVNPFAFCYHEPIDDYFIGLSYHHHESIEVFEVLSLRTNSWEKLDLNHHFRTPYSYFRTPYLNLGTFFNGAIHFIAYSHGSHISPHIIAFDVTTKELRRVPRPFYAAGVLCSELGVHKGCLTITGERERCEILVWVMREYGVKSSWIKLISVSLYCGVKVSSLPIVFFKEGDEFVTTYHGGNFEGLSKLNSKGELLEHRTYGPNFRKRPQVWSPASLIPSIDWRTAIAYTETLLPLP